MEKIFWHIQQILQQISQKANDFIQLVIVFFWFTGLLVGLIFSSDTLTQSSNNLSRQSSLQENIYIPHIQSTNNNNQPYYLQPESQDFYIHSQSETSSNPLDEVE